MKRAILLGIMGFVVAACSRQVQPVRSSTESITVAKQRATPGVDLYLLIDESGSMSGAQGTDPGGLRFEASKYLVQNLLVKKADPRAPNRIAVLHFGDVSRTDGLHDLNIGGVSRITQAIRAPGDSQMGNTNFLSGFRQAVELDQQLPKNDATRRKILVVFTDGEPDDSRRLPLRDYFAEIREFAKSKLPGFELFVIGIDSPTGKVKFSETIADWKQVAGNENVFALNGLQDLYSKFNEAVRRIFELPPIEPVTVTKQEDFEVLPYLDKLEIHGFTDSKVTVSVRRPDGTIAKAGERGVSIRKEEGYFILTIDEPAPGTWRYEITEGQGSVRILRNPVPFRLRLSYPGPVFPLGKPLLLRASFTKENGDEVTELPDFPLSFTAKILSAEEGQGFEADVRFLPEKKAGKVYYADTPVNLPKAGRYDIRLRVKGGMRVDSSSTERIFVQAFPYVEPVSPTFFSSVPLGDQLEVEVRLQREGKPATPGTEYVDNPNDLILAQIVSSPGGSHSPALWLNHAGSGVYRGAIPFPLVQGGYSLALRLKGQARIQNQLIPNEGVETIEFQVSPSLIQRWQARLKGASLWVIPALVVWVVLVLIWFTTLSGRFTGTLDLRVGENEWIVGAHDRLRYLWPKRFVIEEQADQDESDDEEGTKRPARLTKKVTVKAWLRASNEESVVVHSGGWWSLFTFGVFHKKARATKEDGDIEIGNYIKGKLGN